MKSSADKKQSQQTGRQGTSCNTLVWNDLKINIFKMFKFTKEETKFVIWEEETKKKDGANPKNIK